MELREKIAGKLHECAGCVFTPDIERALFKDIINYPEMKQALHLLSLQQQGKLVILDDDQKTPDHNQDTFFQEYYCEGWNDAETEMTKAGFKKVLPLKE